MSDFCEFWNRQRVSLHRSGMDDYYARKAREHAGVITEAGIVGPIADLGCGAGELLSHFSKILQVEIAIDFSASMLEEAKRRLNGQTIQLIQSDALTAARNLTCPVWISCGAVGQYLDALELRLLVRAFSDAVPARALVLFDCVDPARYGMQLPSSLYPLTPVAPPGVPRRIKAYVRAMWHGLKLTMNGAINTGHRLGSIGMGYGYFPAFWQDLCAGTHLHCHIVSSGLYEYRYHVIIRKA